MHYVNTKYQNSRLKEDFQRLSSAVLLFHGPSVVKPVLLLLPVIG